MTNQEARTVIEYIKRAGKRLNAYNNQFLESVTNRLERGIRLSADQTKHLLNIYAEVTGGGKYEERQRI